MCATAPPKEEVEKEEETFVLRSWQVFFSIYRIAELISLLLYRCQFSSSKSVCALCVYFKNLNDYFKDLTQIFF